MMMKVSVSLVEETGVDYLAETTDLQQVTDKLSHMYTANPCFYKYALKKREPNGCQ